MATLRYEFVLMGSGRGQSSAVMNVVGNRPLASGLVQLTGAPCAPIDPPTMRPKVSDTFLRLTAIGGPVFVDYAENPDPADEPRTLLAAGERTTMRVMPGMRISAMNAAGLFEVAQRQDAMQLMAGSQHIGSVGLDAGDELIGRVLIEEPAGVHVVAPVMIEGPVQVAGAVGLLPGSAVDLAGPVALAGGSEVAVRGPVQVSGSVGLAEGTAIALVAGTRVQLADGSEVALKAGTAVALAQGTTVGLAAGAKVGLSDGAQVALVAGQKVGLTDGAQVALAPGTKVPLGSTEDFIGHVGSNTRVVTGSFNRPADTIAYAVGDVIGGAGAAAAAAVMVLPGVTRIPGGSGRLVRARVSTNDPAFAQTVRVHFFKTNVAPVGADNSVLKVANYVNYYGWADCGLTANGILNDGAKGFVSFAPPILFDAADGVSDMYCILEARSAFTPKSGQRFAVTVEVDPD